MRRWAWLFAGLLGCTDAATVNSDAGTPALAPWPGLPTEVPVVLSGYGFFGGPDLAAQLPLPGVLPYDVNAPLWSDRAEKRRFVVLPPGKVMGFSADAPFELPLGAVLIKSFGFPEDFGAPGSPVRWVETRLLVHTSEGWDSHIYVWDDDQRDAVRKVSGRIVQVAYRRSGEAETHPYVIPNTNQCQDCHMRHKVVEPLGLTARQLDGANRLADWVASGALDGLPAQRTWPVLVDPLGDSPLDTRARSWLDANCGHCHRPGGEGGPSGLVLGLDATSTELGVCKGPVAAGPASEGALFDIAPGDPDGSILVKRITTLDPGNKMPEIPNLLADEDGIALMRAWIEAMDGGCE